MPTVTLPPPTARVRAAGTTKWQHIVAEMDRLSLRYTFEPQYNLDQLDTAHRRVQVRESDHVAPKDMVSRYAIQMGEIEFPPIIVTKDAWVVDGNTRKEAKKKRGDKFHPAFVLDIDCQHATPQEEHLLTILGATLNAENGQPLTAAERRKSVTAMIEEGWRPEQIARALGIVNSVVTMIKRELAALAKLKRVNVSADGIDLKPLRGLGTADVLALNDAPYRDLVLLAKDAGLGFTEIRDLAKKAKDTGSDEGAVDVIAEAREEMAERIATHSLTGNGRPPASSLMRARAVWFCDFENTEERLIERNPDLIERHLSVIDKMIGVLSRVKTLQVS